MAISITWYGLSLHAETILVYGIFLFNSVKYTVDKYCQSSSAIAFVLTEQFNKGSNYLCHLHQKGVSNRYTFVLNFGGS